MANTLSITSDDVRKGILAFKPGSAGGPDGLLPQHLKDLTAEPLGEISQDLLVALQKVFNDIIFCGNIPKEVCPTFFGATLIALSKPNGGVRPIAIGMTLRRLMGKICMFKLKEVSAKIFNPHQLGVGTPRGAEVAAHACRRYVSHPQPAGHVILKIDFKNAFNTVRRDVVLRESSKHVPSIFPFVWQPYAQESILFYENSTLRSREGVQQGDPLGPFLFSLAIQSLIKNCQSELNIWYLDDGILGGQVQSVLADFGKIIEAGDSLGLKVNPAKCELVVLNADQSAIDEFRVLAPDIQVVKVEDMTLLGSPILPTATKEVLTRKLQELENMSDRLSEVDSHDALFLIKNCFYIPKLMYFMRSAPCFLDDTLDVYDKVIRQSLQKILNIQLHGDTWTQCSLPVKLGGLGVRSAKDLSLPAFISSAYACDSVMSAILPHHVHPFEYPNLSTACSAWAEKVGNSTDMPTNKTVQSTWDLPLCNLKFSKLLGSTSSTQDKSRLLAVSAPHSSDWVNATPIPSLGLKLDSTQLRIACALRLGSPLCHPHICICGTEVNSTGVHGLSCRRSSGRFPRHCQVNDLIKRALTSAEFPSVLEPLGVSRTDGKRPDGMTIFPWKNGRILVWDFTCCDTVAPSHVSTSSQAPGKIAENAESSKLIKYANLQETYEVVPVGVETFGPWGQHGLKLIKEIGSKIRTTTGEIRSTSFLLQSISMAIQRGNSASVLGTIAGSKNLEEVFYL